MTEKIISDKTALLIMDYQPDILSFLGEQQETFLKNATQVLDIARAANMRVIYITVAFRPGYPEVNAQNLMFGQLKQNKRLVLNQPGTEIHTAVAPRDDDVVIVKHRVNAFMGTELDMVLRAHGIDTLVMCGVTTGGVVLSTLRFAADMDYRCFVIQDCCADRDPDVHRCLVEKIFPRQALVINSSQFKSSLA